MSRCPCLPIFCFFYVGEIFPAGVTEETAGIVYAPASRADNFAFATVLLWRSKR
jgi:hypothetical protein